MMAASLGLAHEACYPPAATSSYSYFPSPPAPPGAGDLVVADQFPPTAAAAAMAGADEDCYFDLFGHQDMVGARARGPGGCGGFCSPPAPVLDNAMSGLLSYGGGVDDGDDGMRRPTPTMSGLLAGTGRNGGGRRLASRIGFRTRSEVDVLDDGFKWRKYGKKAVKSSPNPRNYYRCSAEGCGVKKRVERDCDDPRYVLTTYDGVHNHAAPAAAYHLCRPPPPPPPQRGASAATPFSAPLACSASAAAAAAHPLAAPPSWSAAACDAWEAQLHAAAAAAAHSSESSY